MHYFAVQEWSHDLRQWVITHVTADAVAADRIRRARLASTQAEGETRVIVARPEMVRAFCGR